jgi:hypothetical protein
MLAGLDLDGAAAAASAGGLSILAVSPRVLRMPPLGVMGWGELPARAGLLMTLLAIKAVVVRLATGGPQACRQGGLLTSVREHSSSEPQAQWDRLTLRDLLRRSSSSSCVPWELVATLKCVSTISTVATTGTSVGSLS